MNKPLVLSGYDLVAKGITKNQASLPELGLKDVFPNGSWLEEKQIQSAIDARKQLIATERIEKSGMLSQAEWRENLMLAEVIQKCGGHWQYMGHNARKQLYLYPEETLFLIEINSLLLKHNDVKVSLQQAYALLLRDKNSFIQYKVYATLSRWGYKVFRHIDTNITSHNICNVDEKHKADIKLEINKLQNSTTEELREGNEKNKGSNSQSYVITESYDMENKCDKEGKSIPIDDNLNVEERNLEEVVLTNPEITSKPKVGVYKISPDSQYISNDVNTTIKCKKSKNKNRKSSIYRNKIEKHKNRQFKPSNAKNLHISFDNLPNFLNSEIVSIKVPEKRVIPNNICLSKSSFTLNLNSVKAKQLQPPSPPESQTSTSTDEVNRVRIRNVRSNNYRNQFHPYFQHSPVIDPRNNIFRPFNCWPSFVRANYYQFNMTFQRPFLGNLLLNPRFQYFPRFQNLNRPHYTNFAPPYNRNRGNRKRPRDNTKRFHLESLKKLAARLKNLVVSGQLQNEPLNALNNLIQTYNSRYGSKIKLSSDYEIIESENILETIELEHGGDTIKNKKPRLNSISDTYTINFNSIKQLANKLKSFENGNKSSARHRRAFSSLVKTFNAFYNADIYVTTDFEVIDRRFIILETSSDSDCLIDKSAESSSGKKVRNPFNILKRLSEKRNQSLDAPGTSSETFPDEESNKNKDYRDVILKNFAKEWIPDDNDFGRPEIVSGAPSNNIYTDNVIYDFMKFHPSNYENWLDLKVSFLRSLEETADYFRKKTDIESIQNKPIISPEDCVDVDSVLKKLSIIQANDTAGETSLVINFDVYNRDVQNFKKTKPPPPHFRISCLNESEKFPNAEEIASLHAKYKDDVPIVFAVVGSGTVNFVQINPISLALHISSNET